MHRQLAQLWGSALPSRRWSFDQCLWCPTSVQPADVALWAHECLHWSSALASVVGAPLPPPPFPPTMASAFSSVRDPWVEELHFASGWPSLPDAFRAHCTLTSCLRYLAAAHTRLALDWGDDPSCRETPWGDVSRVIRALQQADGDLAVLHTGRSWRKHHSQPEIVIRHLEAILCLMSEEVAHITGHLRDLQVRQAWHAGAQVTAPCSGGRCGMFSPQVEEEDEEEEKPSHPSEPHQSPLQGAIDFMRRHVDGDLSTAKRLGRTAGADGGLRGTATNLFEEATSSDERISSLEGSVANLQGSVVQLQEMVQQLLSLAQGMGVKPPAAGAGKPPASVPSGVDSVPPADRARKPPVPVSQTDGQAATSNLSAVQPAAARVKPETEVAVRQLEQEDRKDRQRVLKSLMPWCKEVHVLAERAAKVQRAFTAEYGTPTYSSGGGVAAIDQFVQHCRASAYEPSADLASPPRFRFNSAIVLGPVLHRWGGTGRKSDPWSCSVTDFKPLGEGEDKQLIHVGLHSVAVAPDPADRKPPRTMSEFRESAVTFAHVMSLFCGPRVERELAITIRTLYDKGMRSPALMPVPVACHLFDQVVSMAVEGVYAHAQGLPLYDIGTDALTQQEQLLYATNGWGTSGPTFIVRPQSEYLRQWYAEPLQAAALADSTRANLAMTFLGMERRPRVAPRGEPTGAVPLGGAAPALKGSDYQAAQEGLLGTVEAGRRVCFQFLSRQGCQRSQCAFEHLSVRASDLRRRCATCPTLQRVLGHFGGPKLVDNVTVEPAKGAAGVKSHHLPPQPVNKAGGAAGDESGSDSDGSVASSTVSGGKSSGGSGVQVPYLLDLHQFYPNAPRDDIRSTPLAGRVARPAAVHRDPPTRPFVPGGLERVNKPVLSRAGRVSSTGERLLDVGFPDAHGLFTVRVGPFAFQGQELGQTLVLEHGTVDNACVTLSFAAALNVPPQSLFHQLLREVYTVSESLGPPADWETPTTVMVRSLVHDVAASCLSGHALDSLIFAYFPPKELADRVVVVVHYRGDQLALDVLFGTAATHSSPTVFCLHRRGHPGHMQPLTSKDGCSVAAALSWAQQEDVPVRRVSAVGWRAMIDDDDSGPSAQWNLHSVCDFCHGPRFPLPPSPHLS